MAADNTGDPGSFGVHTFTAKLMDTQIYFQVLKFESGLFCWVGTSPTKFGDLVMAIKTKFDTTPTTSTLLGSSESPCNAIAQRLAKRTGKQVFVGGNLSYNQILLPLVEKRIGEEIKAHPEVFMQ